MWLYPISIEPRVAEKRLTSLAQDILTFLALKGAWVANFRFKWGGGRVAVSSAEVALNCPV